MITLLILGYLIPTIVVLGVFLFSSWQMNQPNRDWDNYDKCSKIEKK